MKKISLFITSIFLILSLISCATFKNTKDLASSNSDKIGHISSKTITWSWTNFSNNGNSDFNNKLYDKLYNKAVKQYGTDIDLSNVVITDSIGPNIGIHLGSMLLGSVLCYSMNDIDKLSDPEYKPNVAYGLAYLPTLCKLVSISADVIKNESEEREYGNFIPEKSFDLAYQVGKSDFTDREKEAILNKQIFIGMSEAALIMSWGNPERINTSNYGYGIQKQYCYSNQYVYVENGVITAWN